MNPDLRTLAAAIVALPGWEWRAGMCAIFPSGQGVHVQALGAPSGVCGAPPAACLPDITDPATGGALLALMANVSIEVGRHRDSDSMWRCSICPDDGEWVPGYGDTPGEAIARLALKRGGWV